MLDEALTASLRDLSRRDGATTYMSLLAALATLLNRYTSQTDITVGTPSAGRIAVQTRALIGAFINTLVLRLDVSDNPTFRELIARARKTALEAYSHQDLPYSRLVSAVNPQRDSTGPSLLQVMLVLQNSPLPAVELPGLKFELLDIDPGKALYDLTVELQERAGRLVGWIEYDKDLFDAETIERMAGHFVLLLKGMTAAPDEPVCRLPILTEAERHQILVAWNDTGEDHGDDQILPHLFDAQVDRTPDAIAVEDEDGRLSYRELQGRADLLARHLIACGVRPGVLVGICVERSTWMLAGLLGILKAGGAYVPLDPDHPRDRLSAMIVDAHAPLILTQRQLIDRLPAHVAEFICLEDCSAESSRGADQGIATSPSCRDDTAYVIYTSGSTGKPKGVVITHRSLTNFLLGMRSEPGLKPFDRLLAVTTICFDMSVLELYLPLIAGACVVIASREVATSGALLIERLHSARITVMQATPATWRMVVEAGWPGESRMKLISGGEPLDHRLAEALLERSGELWNGYGPTETTDFSTIHLVNASSASIPIGRPIRNTQVYVLDSQLQPVPIGINGELYIGGSGVARGYLNQPEMTAERFLNDPFCEGPGARIYKTGDVVRWRPDGCLEYLGRADHQVKIRGYRIELGEIESVLLRHPAVQKAVVVARQDLPGDTRLVGYIATDPAGNAPTAMELRTHLMASLPDYMVPSPLVVLEALALTPNGKVDRKALPVPDMVRSDLDEHFTAPRTQVEWELVRIWSQTLGIDKVGIHDNFFELGGHSLLANQVISRINNTFPVKLPLRRMFETPTVAGLAQALQSETAGEIRGSIRLLKPGGTGPALFLVHDGLGDTLLYKSLAVLMPDNVKVFGIEPLATGYCPILHTRIPEMAAYYAQQMRQIQPEGPYMLGGLCAGGKIAFEMALQLQAQGLPIGFVALLDAPGPRMQLKSGLTQQRRLNRFNAELSTEENGSRLHRLLKKSAKVSAKVRGLLVYETTSRAQKLFDAFRFRMLRGVLDHERPVSRSARGLKVQVVLSLAGQEYSPDQQLEGRAVLFRATQGEGIDEPLANLSTDPLLDWGDRVKEPLEVCDMPGGHSSMIQEPHVKELADRLNALIEQAVLAEVLD